MRKYSLFALILLITTGVFAQDSKTTLGGYGELHFNKFTYNPGKDMNGTLDFHRFVIYVGHDFNDWISFKSELELEHTKVEVEAEKDANGFVKEVEGGGEVALEQAYIDLTYSKLFGLRAGLLLVPVGIINEIHEPSTFHGVERPNVERNIIPATWRESGIGLYGELTEGLKYKAYLMAGLKETGINESGIRGGRQEGFESSTKNIAVTARLEYVPVLGLKNGISYYTSSLNESRINLFETDAQYSFADFEFRGLIAYSSISDVDKLIDETGNNISESQFGFYAEGAYNFLPIFLPETEQKLFAFARYEKYDTQNKVSSKAIADGKFNKYETTFGFTYKPAENVALKADYQFFGNATGAKPIQQLNFGIGYFFY